MLTVVIKTLVYPVYMQCCIPCIPLFTLCTHVYPSNTVYLVYPGISCLPMLTLVILDTLYTPIYPVYPCLPQ